MLARTMQTTVPLIFLLSVALLAGCATSDMNHAYSNRTSCPPSFVLYCRTFDHGSLAETRKCRCVRQDSFN